MNIALVGWGVETKSAYCYYGPDHTYLIVNEEPAHDFPVADNVAVHHLSTTRPIGLTGNAADLSYLEGLESYDVVVITPVSRKNLERVYPADSPIWPKITTTLQLFFELSPTSQIIGVTGTKGKGTTSSLIYEMLRASGKTAHLAGNIGEPMLDLLPTMQSTDWVVLELSSFQLYKFPYSPHIGVHLMMLPEHIEEWHKTMEDYVHAKGNLFANQSDNDIAIYYPKNEYSTSNAQRSTGTKIPYFEQPGAHINEGFLQIGSDKICAVDEVALRGAHNLQNICAAVTAVWQVAQNVDAIRQVIRSFTGLPHRLQIVRTHNDITYVDDSFGTTPDTTLVALDSFSEQKVLITGGHDKGSNYQLIVDHILRGDVRHVVAIGPIGNWIAEQLQRSGYQNVTYHEEPNNWTMQQIIDTATSHARKGDVVLLSAGTSSFGIFKDYKDRGNQFIEVVQALQ